MPPKKQNKSESNDAAVKPTENKKAPSTKESDTEKPKSSNTNSNTNKQNQHKDSPNTNAKKGENKQNTQKSTQQKEVPFILPEDRKAINDLKNKIEAANKQVEKITEEVESKITKKNEIQEEEYKLKGQLNYENKRVTSIEEKKQLVLDQIAVEEKARKTKQDEVTAFKKTVDDRWNLLYKQPMDATNKASNLGKLDTRLKALNEKISTTSMPLNEEKKIVNEINSLTQLKTLVKDYHQRLYETSDNYKKEQNEKRIKSLDDKIAERKASQTAQQEKVNKIHAEFEVLDNEINEKIAKRKELRKTIKEHEKGLVEISKKIDQQKEKWIKEREEERKKREEEREAKRKEREAARLKRESERAAKEAKTKPFDEEVRGANKLIKELTSQWESFKSLDEKQQSLKKDLKLGVESLVLFELLSLATPLRNDQLEASIESVKAKKAWLEELRKQLPGPLVEETVEGKEEESDQEKEAEDEEKAPEEDDVEKFAKVSAADLIGANTSVVPDEEVTQKEEVKEQEDL